MKVRFRNFDSSSAAFSFLNNAFLGCKTFEKDYAQIELV